MSEIFDKSVIENLRELQEQIGEDIVSEMVNEYVEVLPSEIKKIKDCLELGDLDGASSISHALKSSSANVGAMGISQLAESLESSVFQKTDDIDSLMKIHVSMENLISETLDCLKAA